MSLDINKKDVEHFQIKIFSWWEKNKRDFPWRKTTDPYEIMVSEFMLQQTQANRVIDKYNSFIGKFPSVQALAIADPAEIIKLWSGLGYNRRALWLHEAAQKIGKLGFFPQTIENLKKLKGIGSYSSRSILIFAFNLDIATVDTNIRRILITEKFANESSSEKELLGIAHKLVPKNRSRDWHNALMDYASLELTVTKTGIKPKTSQSKFEGSNRQLRGKILKMLTKIQKLNYEEIKNKLEISDEKIYEIINSLKKDKLIDIKEDLISLPGK
ncbi:MAG: A/G-specific adenine glycosylase [Candidatus Heimdallarchaeota archaeon LC_3]|nr:MAG: A/G-specific adenine glycosylase [Candidatus Heimdallarchaeota archaeon LC_3]